MRRAKDRVTFNDNLVDVKPSSMLRNETTATRDYPGASLLEDLNSDDDETAPDDDEKLLMNVSVEDDTFFVILHASRQVLYNLESVVLEQKGAAIMPRHVSRTNRVMSLCLFEL